jgi:hypothetical protein
MFQWWYQFITLAPVYYSLFIATATIYLVRAKRLLHAALWGTLIAYLAACFALVLYPPFQIACGLALGAFIAGYLLQALRGWPRAEILQKLGLLGGAAVFTGLVVFLFVHTRAGVISAIANSAYPGERVVASGGFDAAHIFSGHLGFLFQSMTLSNHYQILQGAFLNQSESSNFILLLPFLLLPSLYIVVQDYRRRKPVDWPLIAVNLCFLFIVAWMLVPHLDILGKPFLLEQVTLIRLLLGLGLLNIIQLVLVVRRLQNFKGKLFGVWQVGAYACVVFAIQLGLGLFAMDRSPGFIVPYQVVALALPVPVIIFLLLRKHFALAVAGFLAFSVFSAGLVNPLYRGTEVLTQTPLVQAIKEVNSKEPGIWATDTIYLENFAALSGAPSLSGVYAYPQLDVWRSAEDQNNKDTFNRYAHVNFIFDRNTAAIVPTEPALPGLDHVDIITEPCGSYLRTKQIRYIITVKPINDTCLEVVKTVNYPTQDILIYKIK